MTEQEWKIKLESAQNLVASVEAENNQLRAALAESQSKLTAAQASAAAMRGALEQAARCAHWYEWHDHKAVPDRASLEARTSDAIITALASNAGTELLQELERLRAEEKALLLALERAKLGNGCVATERDRAIAQRDQALAVARELGAVLDIYCSEIPSAASALAKLAALFATRPDGPQGEGV